MLIKTLFQLSIKLDWQVQVHDASGKSRHTLQPHFKAYQSKFENVSRKCVFSAACTFNLQNCKIAKNSCSTTNWYVPIIAWRSKHVTLCQSDPVWGIYSKPYCQESYVRPRICTVRCTAHCMSNTSKWKFHQADSLIKTDVPFPTPPGCLFSWLVSTTYQDALVLFWTVSLVMTSTEGTDGKQCHECPLCNRIQIEISGNL